MRNLIISLNVGPTAPAPDDPGQTGAKGRISERHRVEEHNDEGALQRYVKSIHEIYTHEIYTYEIYT